jgi:hypothetical protein
MNNQAKENTMSSPSTNGRQEREELLVPQEVVFSESETIENDGYIDDTSKVIRVVEGKLAEDVRMRVGAPLDAKVWVTEEEFDGWISDVTSEHTWTTTIECYGVTKEFESYDAGRNFKALLQWLDEEPATA